MSTPLYKCANCGAILHRLNMRCGYCNHWNVDPANPQDPPSATAPAAPSASPTPQAAPPPAPAPAPAPVAVAAPVVAPVAAAQPVAPAAAEAPKRRLFGSKPEVAPAAPVADRRGGAGPSSGLKPGPSKPTIVASPRSRVLQSVVAQPEASSTWEKGRKSFNSRSAPAGREEQDSLARIQAVMAVAYWVATSDDEDEMDDDEYDAIVDTFAELLGEDVDEAELETTIAAWDEAIEDDEEAFLAEAVEAIGQGPMRRQALEIATVVAAADDDLSDIEEEALGELATALGFADRESERIIEKALESLEE
jgi:tellurite resistance protein